MADITAATWDQTDANNSTASPDGAPEGMAPGGLNDTMRMMMGAEKRAYTWSEIPTSTAGTSTVYTLSYTVAPTALVDGMSHLVLFDKTCGATPTLNINTLGAKPLHYFTGTAWAAVTAGLIAANMIVKLTYNAAAGTYRIYSFPSAINTATLAGDNTYTGANTFAGTVTMSAKALNEAIRVDVASATTCDIGAAASNYVRITGTTTITGLGTIASGARRHVVFSGILTLTHNGTSLILPNATNDITTAAGDTALFISEGSGNWRCEDYQKASGLAVAAPQQRAYAYATMSGTTITIQKSSGVTSIVRNSQGRYTVTLSTAMPDANYRVQLCAESDLSLINADARMDSTFSRTTTVFRFYCAGDSTGVQDFDAINIEVFA